MSDKQPPRVQLNFEPDPIVTETEEENPNFIYEDDNEVMPEGVVMPEVVEKKSIVQEDIFDVPSLMKSMKQEDKSIVKHEEEVEEVVKEVKKGKVTKSGKPRKPMTEEHKAKLALAREKATIARRAKAVERKKDKAMDSETKQLQKLKKEKDFNKLKKQVIEDDSDIDEVVEPKLVRQNAVGAGFNGLTKADLELAQFEAIMKYELLRKERKEEKKKQQKLESQKQEIMNKLAPQTSGYGSRNSNGRLNNRWDSCY